MSWGEPVLCVGGRSRDCISLVLPRWQRRHDARRDRGGFKILIDLNIRAAADDPDDETPDVAKELRDRLTRDSQGRLYMDALLVSHPDEDHCRGLHKHFHLGPLDDWSKRADKVLIREFWSSPMVFRRASRQHVLCDDAKAFNSEARRRVRKHRELPWSVGDGDRILILGEDEDGKTDDLQDILVRVDEEFSRINGPHDDSMQARLLAPLPADDVDDEELLSKNNSSTILRFSLKGGGMLDKCRFLTGATRRSRSGRKSGAATPGSPTGCPTTSCCARIIVPGTACHTTAGASCARRAKCRTMRCMRCRSTGWSDDRGEQQSGRGRRQRSALHRCQGGIPGHCRRRGRLLRLRRRATVQGFGAWSRDGVIAHSPVG